MMRIWRMLAKRLKVMKLNKRYYPQAILSRRSLRMSMIRLKTLSRFPSLLYRYLMLKSPAGNPALNPKNKSKKSIQQMGT